MASHNSLNSVLSEYDLCGEYSTRNLAAVVDDFPSAMLDASAGDWTSSPLCRALYHVSAQASPEGRPSALEEQLFMLVKDLEDRTHKAEALVEKLSSNIEGKLDTLVKVVEQQEADLQLRKDMEARVQLLRGLGIGSQISRSPLSEDVAALATDASSNVDSGFAGETDSVMDEQSVTDEPFDHEGQDQDDGNASVVSEDSDCSLESSGGRMWDGEEESDDLGDGTWRGAGHQEKLFAALTKLIHEAVEVDPLARSLPAMAKALGPEYDFIMLRNLTRNQYPDLSLYEQALYRAYHQLPRWATDLVADIFDGERWEYVSVAVVLPTSAFTDCSESSCDQSESCWDFSEAGDKEGDVDCEEDEDEGEMESEEEMVDGDDDDARSDTTYSGMPPLVPVTLGEDGTILCYGVPQDVQPDTSYPGKAPLLRFEAESHLETEQDFSNMPPLIEIEDDTVAPTGKSDFSQSVSLPTLTRSPGQHFTGAGTGTTDRDATQPLHRRPVLRTDSQNGLKSPPTTSVDQFVQPQPFRQQSFRGHSHSFLPCSCPSKGHKFVSGERQDPLGTGRDQDHFDRASSAPSPRTPLRKKCDV